MLPTNSVSIVIPCRNEEKRLSERRLRAFLDTLSGSIGSKVELVLEEDGSTDGTGALIDSIARRDRRVRAIHGKGRLGKGGGLALGVERSRGEFIVMCDADLPVPARDVALAVQLLAKNDLVAPSRRLPGSRTSGIPFLRRLFSRIYNLYVNAVLGIGLSDTQLGVKVFRKSIFAKIRPVRFTSFSMDVEMLARARRAGLRMAEVPAEYHHTKETGFNWFSEGPKMLLDVLVMRFSL